MIILIITLLYVLCIGASLIALSIMCLMDMEHFSMYGTFGYIFLSGFLGMILSRHLIAVVRSRKGSGEAIDVSPCYNKHNKGDVMNETVRDVTIDRIQSIMELFVQLPPDKQKETLRATVIDIANDVFSSCGISEKEQNEEW